MHKRKSDDQFRQMTPLEAAAGQKLPSYRPRDNRDVHPQRPFLDVVEIMVDTRDRQSGLDRASPATAYLSKAGDTWACGVALKIVRNQILVGHIGGEHAGNMRPRSNKGHVALDDIDQLRNLVEAGAPQNSSNPRDPDIPLNRLLDACDVGDLSPHRPELVYLEQPVAISVTILLKEDWSARCRFDRNGNGNEHWSEEQQRQARRCCIENPLADRQSRLATRYPAGAAVIRAVTAIGAVAAILHRANGYESRPPPQR